MFAAQASTLKIESKRNEVYTLRRSVEKTPNKPFETPVRKADRKDLKHTPVENEGKDEKAYERLMQEIDEIEDYL